MLNLELPLHKRTKLYRFFEIVPGGLSYALLSLMVVLSIVNPLWASIYLLLLIVTMIFKAAGIAVHSIAGALRLRQAQRIDWSERLSQLSNPVKWYDTLKDQQSSGFAYQVHVDNLGRIAGNVAAYPKPKDVYQLIVIAAYNEPYEVIQPTLQSLVDSTYDSKHMIIVFGYEERGGTSIEQTVKRLQKEYKSSFYDFRIVKHPAKLPNEVVGKGPNITYAAKRVQPWLAKQPFDLDNVIVTTLDCDNKPHRSYFSYLTYEFIINEDRQQLSFQPIALYFGNIWDAPAPMRIIAIGNSFWTVVSSVRPHTLRNFAAHSQPLRALTAMDYWSKRSIVEDGHQYWRSYFFFKGEYDIIPIYVPIYQDAVLGATLKSTLIAQFKQLRRWGYGASDVPYVATRLFSRHRMAPFWPTLARFIRLMDSHVTLSTVALMVAVGAWIPLLLNPEAAYNITAHNLPHVVSIMQRFAMIGLMVTIILSLTMLPPRPSRLKRRRSIGMVLQWVLMPLTAILYSSFASLNAQTHLMLGKYLDTFDVTEKTTRETADTQSATS
ncbi:glycosyltransferase family 2 protein [Candidatus Saccharibacteria bacterium]|nr:glycosyltransferase family 2 protein [Candidatus Saccharibacteria bacterium]